MRAYIFTDAELNAIEQYFKTGKRNPTVNKVFHYIRRNKRLIAHVELLLILMMQAHRKPVKEFKPPGRPPKILNGMV
ncbi:hypothetical protein H5T51_04920 [Candidatus Bathyarchaeota archaeon]|nr:hypothetical protein [Candidatus Bathyarchaeota archaeon]